MADRDLMLPQRAFQSTMQDILRRLDRIEQRMKFPSSVRYAFSAGPTTMTGGSSYDDLEQITLDPGRWVILGGSLFQFSAGGAIAAEPRLRIRLTGTFGTEDYEGRSSARTGTAGAAIYDAILIATSSSRNVGITVTLQAMVPLAWTTKEASSYYLLAVPN